MSLGSNIKAIREKKGISLDSISSDLKIFKKYYKKIEKGSEIPNDKLLSKISKVLAVSINEIYSYNPISEETFTKPKRQTSVIKDDNYRDIISIKKRLISTKKFKSLKNKLNLVSVDKDLTINEDEEVNKPYKTSSPSILNYVEPYEVKGVDKTLFYTEVNTGFKKGDRVFIVNGNYDSNTLIKKSKYRGGRDGYKVLFIDKCKIVLDINYNETKPQKVFDRSNVLNVFKVSSDEDFLYVNRQVVSDDNINFISKFDTTTNNIIYVTKNFTDTPITNWGHNNGINDGEGFYSKDNDNWIKVTDELIDGSIFDNRYVSKIIICDDDIVFDNFLIRKDKAYGFDDEGKLDILTEYNKPFISKSNFRGGNFKGEWNSGIFGNQENKVKWDGEYAQWNLGTAMNVNWERGKMNSNYTLKESYISEFEGNKPYQKLNIEDNNGWGYNYLIDSVVNEIESNGCNIKNSNIGTDLDYSIVEKFISKSDYNNFISLNKCNIEESFINSSNIEESDIKNSISKNSKLDNIKSINSTYKKSIIEKSKYINEEGIKILDYDEISAPLMYGSSNYTHKIYKFYVSKKSYNKIKKDEYFYINNIKIKDSKYPLNFFDKKFKIGNWTEFIESYNNSDGFIKRGIDFSCFLNINDEKYSIDIIVSLNDINAMSLENRENTPLSELYKNGLDIEKPTGIYKKNKKGILDISDAFINTSDFDGGIIHKSDWVNGNQISINNDINIDLDTVKVRNRKALEVPTTSLNNDKKDSNKNSILKGDVLFLNNLYYEKNGSFTKLPDSYKVINNDFQLTNKVVLKEIGGGNIIDGIVDNMQQGTYSIISKDIDNRYNYLYRTKIDSCKIYSGKFRRSYIVNSFIENSEMDISKNNKDLVDNDLILSDVIFRNNNNILSNAIYLHSFIKGTDDKLSDDYINGIVFRSVWEDMTFNNGIFKESSWLSGTFKKGYLTNNNSFNDNSTPNHPSFTHNNIKSYYLKGETNEDNYNNRLSWRSGEFENGEIYKTDWEDGTFKNGVFNGSMFYGGTIKGGLIGSLGSSVYDTNIFGGKIENTTVINASLIAKNTNKQETGLTSKITWEDGIFNDGIFGTDESNPDNKSIWEGGEFNGGQFRSKAKWKNGIFNGGKFISNLGYQKYKSTNKTDYTWEDGIFNDGVFGNGDLEKNSTWYNGEFNDGKFIGRVWNDGIFSFGQFLGGGDKAIGGDKSEKSNEFVESYDSGKFYGLWRNGILTDKKDSFKINKNFYIKGVRRKERKKIKKAEFRNALWCNGTFKHNNGEINNSVWLSGEFSKGNFINSSFNPFTKRPNENEKSFDTSDSCYWKSGTFEGGEFYISKWENGLFKSGSSYGMIWKNGISNYMNAYNIFWESGTWKNGNWYGSDIKYDGSVDDDFDKAIIDRGFEWMSINNISNLSCHIWNIFDGGDQSGNKVLSLRGKD